LQIAMSRFGSITLLRVQHSAYRKPNNSCNASVFARYRMNVPSRVVLTSDL